MGRSLCPLVSHRGSWWCRHIEERASLSFLSLSSEHWRFQMESCGVRLQLVVEKASGGWMLVPSHVVPFMGQWVASSHLSPRHLLCPLLMTDTCLFLGPTVYFRRRVQQAQSCGCFYYFLFLFYFGFKNHLSYLWAFLYLTPLLLSSPVYFCVKQTADAWIQGSDNFPKIPWTVCMHCLT